MINYGYTNKSVSELSISINGEVLVETDTGHQKRSHQVAGRIHVLTKSAFQRSMCACGTRPDESCRFGIFAYTSPVIFKKLHFLVSCVRFSSDGWGTTPYPNPSFLLLLLLLQPLNLHLLRLKISLTCIVSPFHVLVLLSLIHLRDHLICPIEYAAGGSPTRGTLGRARETLDRACRAEIVSTAGDDRVGEPLSAYQARERDVLIGV
jgi:hypothetical protein